ncbi:conserved hypothetical protein [Vibrio coralliirubri]|nr:conserved hypothetical protein [Vibrio coralliirubri]
MFGCIQHKNAHQIRENLMLILEQLEYKQAIKKPVNRLAFLCSS